MHYLHNCLGALVSCMRVKKTKLKPDKLEALWMGDSWVQELRNLPVLGVAALPLKGQWVVGSISATRFPSDLSGKECLLPPLMVCQLQTFLENSDGPS